MKKIQNLLKTASLIFISIISISCHDVIFDEVRNEVKLSKSQISGNVNSLIRHYDANESIEYLYTSNGRLWRRDINDSSSVTGKYAGYWVQVERPTTKISTIASEYDGAKSYLYAVSSNIQEVSDDGENELINRSIYFSENGTDWNIITDSSDSISFSEITQSSMIFVFGTNTVKKENRAVFANVNGMIYRLQAGVATIISKDSTYIDLSSTSQSVAYLDGKFYFSTNYSMCSNETKDLEATCIYTGSSTVNYRTASDDDWNSVDPSISTIRSIAYTADNLIIGTTAGLEKVILSSDTLDANGLMYVPTNSTGSFSSNAASALSSYYEIWKLLVCDPSLETETGDIFAAETYTGSSSSSSASRQNEGLWAFYPNRGNWNRE